VRDQSDGYDAFYYREQPGDLVGVKFRAATPGIVCSGDLPVLHGPCRRIMQKDCGLP
jgi:hypothetical protein